MVLVETPNRRSSSLVRCSSNSSASSTAPPPPEGRFSPSLKAFKSACQRSFSLRSSDLKRPVVISGKPITGPLLTKKALTLWSETVQSPVRKMCSTNEVKRQEAIFELIQSEKELVGDLLSLNLFYEKLKSANLLSKTELNIVFNCYQSLGICHQDLVTRVMTLRDENGRFGPIGDVVLNWVDSLEEYKVYCPGLINAKNLIDVRLQTSQQFAHVCSECRTAVRSRLDLYSILDKPRARLAKYPLMVRNILKWTDVTHPDQLPLIDAVQKFEKLLKTVDRLTGDAQLAVVRSQLSSSASDPVLSSATRLIFDGPLKTAKGTKVQAFLFDSGLILAKPTTSSSSHSPEYRAFVPGLSADCLVVEDIQLPSHFMYKVNSNNNYKTASGTSLLRDIFGSANRAQSFSGQDSSSSNSSSSHANKAAAMFRVFTRTMAPIVQSPDPLEKLKEPRLNPRRQIFGSAGSSYGNDSCHQDNGSLTSERIALIAHDDHAKRAWLDKLHSVSRVHLTTF